MGRQRCSPWARVECVVSRNAVETRQSNGCAMMLSALNDFPEIAIYDPFAALCDQQFCGAQIDHIALYRDQDHLSHEGSIEIWNRMTARYQSVVTP
jgi:SGNH domain (fused to AT3 domains)